MEIVGSAARDTERKATALAFMCSPHPTAAICVGELTLSGAFASQFEEEVSQAGIGSKDPIGAVV